MADMILKAEITNLDSIVEKAEYLNQLINEAKQKANELSVEVGQLSLEIKI